MILEGICTENRDGEEYAMQELGFTETDWKLFRKRLPIWQEQYMEKLIEEYKALLVSDKPASSKFWELEKRIKLDQKDTGVLAQGISRSNMRFLMMDLISEGAITKDDLEGFSEAFREQLIFYCERVNS